MTGRFNIAASLIAGLMGLGAADAATAADSPFVGTWTMDLAKSQVTGGSFTYTKTETGYAFSDGGPISFTFGLDGQDYPTVPSESVACTETSPTSIACVNKASGKITSSYSDSLSADGGTMTEDYSNYRPNGTTTHGEDVYLRLSGGPGLAGKWKEKSAKFKPSAFSIAMPTATTFEIVQPSIKLKIVGSTDGTPSPATGPTIPPGATESILAAKPLTWTFMITVQGKVYEQGVMVVSPDGKTMTQTSWTPGKESEKEIGLYSKS